MKKHNCIRSIALAIVAASFLVPATASAIPVEYTTVDPRQTVKVAYKKSDGTTWNGSVYAGIYNLEVGDEKTPYRSFCIDIFQYVPDSVENNYSFKDLGEVFSDKAATDINKLWSAYYSDDMSAVEAAGLQLALWEVTTEDVRGDISGGYDLWTGSFYSLNVASNESVGHATTYLTNLGGLAATSSLQALTSSTNQDYVVATAPVPEPATIFLLGSGLVGAAFIRRRKA